MSIWRVNFRSKRVMTSLLIEIMLAMFQLVYGIEVLLLLIVPTSIPHITGSNSSNNSFQTEL